MAGEINITRRGALGFGAAGLAFAARPAWALQALPAARYDEIVRRFMAEFEIPGIAIAVLRPGEAPFTRGYGVRRLGRADPVDTDTLFAIASNTKSFTAATLALLVEEKKLGWDEPVIKYMPEFAMHDPDVTRMMTVRDLLVHRSGLPLGAGDLMQFPLSDHKREEIVRALRHLKPARGFRAGYDYDNILYLVAGEVVQRVSGQSWEEFVAARLLRPLGMRNAVANRPLVRTANVVARHARLGPPARGLGKLELIEADESPVLAAAGGIHASVSDIVPWLQVQLGKGELAGGRRLWGKDQTTAMWTPQVITQSTHGPTPELPTRPVLAGYALGWMVQDYRGRRLIHHSGGLSGQITYTALFPEQGIALAVYSNTEDGAAVSGLRSALLDHLIDAPAFDWVASTRKRMNDNEAEVRKLVGNGDFAAPAGGASLPLALYAGRYRDLWYGDIVVTERAGRLHIDFTRTPVFKSSLEPFGPDAFRTRWKKGAGEDAVVTFTTANGVVTGMKMKALSPLADFSYDFHDLDPRRVD